MEIPYEQLAPETLRNLIEHFVTREGTDYGAEPVPLAQKIAQIHRQLVRGEALIVFDPDSETCNIIAKRDFVAAEKALAKPAGASHRQAERYEKL